jgi:hypothetical protein
MAEESSETPGAPADETKKATGHGSAEDAAPGVADGGAPAAEAAGGATAEEPTDPWGAYDPVLEAFAGALPVGVGTSYGEEWTTAEGRFLGWANRSGWRCTLRLLRPPEEDVVVLVAEGPPLPGGRPRAMVLGGFPREFDAQVLRAALELGVAIGETWGPAEELAPESAANADSSSAEPESDPASS